MPKHKKRKKRKDRNKGECERIHAKKRALERYGLVLNKECLRDLVTRIQTADGVIPIAKQSHRITAFVIEIADVWYPVIYDNKRKEIVTFLPREFLEKRGISIETFVVRKK